MWKLIFVLLLITAQGLGLILLTEQSARAYVDPGSGLQALQILGAAVAGVFYFLRHKILRLWEKYKSGSREVPKNQA